MTDQPAKKPRKVETVRAGACTAVRINGHCDCPGYLPDPTPVGGYRQCVCGHTQPSHALLITSLGTSKPSAPERTKAA